MKLTTKVTILVIAALAVFVGVAYATFNESRIDMNAGSSIIFGTQSTDDGTVEAKDLLTLKGTTAKIMNTAGSYAIATTDANGGAFTAAAAGTAAPKLLLEGNGNARIRGAGTSYGQLSALSDGRMLIDTSVGTGPRLYNSDISYHGFASLRSAQKLDGEVSVGRGFVTAEKGYNKAGSAKLEWMIDTSNPLDGVEDTALATIATDQNGNALMRSDAGGASVTCNVDGDVIIDSGGGGQQMMMGDGDSMTESLETIDPETGEIVGAAPYAENVYFEEFEDAY